MKKIYDKKEILILEGCDKVGKTTIAKDLAKYYGLKYVHTGVPPKSAHKKMYHWHKDILDPLLSDPHLKGVVLDRFHLSNVVYSQVMQHHDCISNVGWTMLEHRLLTEHNPVVVYCYRSEEAIKQAFIDDKEELLTPELIPDIMKAYANILHSREESKYITKLPVVTKIFQDGIHDVAYILNGKYNFKKPTTEEIRFAFSQQYV